MHHIMSEPNFLHEQKNTKIIKKFIKVRVRFFFDKRLKFDSFTLKMKC